MCGAVAGDMHLVPKKDHCNTGCNLDTRTIDGTQRKKEKGNFRYRVPSEYLAVPSDAFLEFYDFDVEPKVLMREQERAAGVVACTAARLAGRYQRSSRC